MQKEDQCLAWKARLLAQKQSGLTVVSWCKSEGITTSTFYYWHKRLSAPVEQPTQLIALPTPASHSGMPTPLELHTPGGYTIRVSHQAQIDLLERLLRVL